MPPASLPQHIVDLAKTSTGADAALYVVDLEGTLLVRLAGDAVLPQTIPLTGALGPELGKAACDELRRSVPALLLGAIVAPLWVRCRATSLLLATGDAGGALEALASEVAPCFELAAHYTDLIDRVRRTRRTSPAAEVQQDLLAPRIARVEGAEIAGSLLPAYGVGGDWFDHADDSPECTWLAVADAMGKGLRASGTAALSLAALRSARRAGDDLEACCRAVHEVVSELGGEPPAFVTAVIATWHAPSRTFAWVRCGHPAPVLVAADGSIEELDDGQHGLPLGIAGSEPRTFRRAERRLEAGERVIIHSDGIAERRTFDGFFGLEGLHKAIAEADDVTAVATAAAIERAVLLAHDNPIADDATQIVLRCL